MAIVASIVGQQWGALIGQQRGRCDVHLVGGGSGVTIGGSPLRQMVYLGRCAIGGWRHTRGRWQESVGFWTVGVGGYGCERTLHSPTVTFCKWSSKFLLRKILKYCHSHRK